MIFSSAVSEIRELNQNEKNSENDYLKTLPAHIIYPEVHVPFEHTYAFN